MTLQCHDPLMMLTQEITFLGQDLVNSDYSD